ncbi:MAG: aspartate/glutamate racemase family protein [Ignavibacteriae bacterium]|nr:MAG: aspartate/glutamate racemase family protein [Ignavibacteriota bacterium]
MKTLGLIGGTTWVSTVDYYRLINQKVNEKLGGDNSAKILLYSLNFAEIKKLIDDDNWKDVSTRYCMISKKLESAGADCIIFCANTAHIIADDVRKAVNIPLIHIAEETANAIKRNKLKKIGLLGTRYTMESDFYKSILSKCNIETLIPDKDDREFIQHTIFDELGKEIFLPESKARYIEIINKLIQQGAEGVILGCTEIPLLIKQDDCPVPVFDTTMIHANAAVEFVVSN